MYQAWLNKFPNSVVGITPLVTIPRTAELKKVARLLPVSRMVLETDAPYLLPTMGLLLLPGSHHQEVLPALHMANVAAQVAAIRDWTVFEVLRASKENIIRIYNI